MNENKVGKKKNKIGKSDLSILKSIGFKNLILINQLKNDFPDLSTDELYLKLKEYHPEIYEKIEKIKCEVNENVQNL